LGVAELEFKIKDPNFLGTVVLAGASDLEDGIASVSKTKLPMLNLLVGFWIFGLKTLYPQLNLEDVLTDKALAVYNTSVQEGCSAASGAFAALATDDVLRPGWEKNQYVTEFLARNRPGELPTYGAVAAGNWRERCSLHRVGWAKDFSTPLCCQWPGTA